MNKTNLRRINPQTFRDLGNGDNDDAGDEDDDDDDDDDDDEDEGEEDKDDVKRSTSNKWLEKFIS